MDKIAGIIMMVCLALLLFSCNRNAKEILYKCKDGTMVNDVNLCPEMKQVQEAAVNQTGPVQQLTNTTPIINNTNATEEKSPLSEIKRDVYKEKNQTTGSYPSLNGWSVDEIINGMAAYNPNILGKYASDVNYDQYTPGYYTRGTTKVADPFYIIRRHTSGGAKEYDFDQFRIEVPVRPEKVLDEVNSKHNDSKFKIVYPDEWVQWNKIRCGEIETCRDIEAIKCTTDSGDEMYMWVHSTPGVGYTEQIKYTMQAVNDHMEMLDTFEKFYCTPR